VYKLVIANRNYSSWSFRAWLFLTESKIPFEEVQIPLFTGTWATEVARFSPAGRLPILLDGDITVWDSTAIIEHVLERFPDAIGWPNSAEMRGHARSISAEMHSGFLAIRDELPQNIRARNKRDLSQLSESCRKQIARIDEIWTDCRRRYGDLGKWLFGDFSISDVMYAPVALRFVTYSIPVSEQAQSFVSSVSQLESTQKWIRAASEEIETIEFIDDLLPAAGSPLTLG